ncbi:MAG: Flp pilus assembly protein CpaB [Desulfosarcina sp.]|nr:Flp pilus assembly protein CpaB [Desulfobacterales bacterium]
MTSKRGIIALCVAVCLALLAAQVVSWQLKRASKPKAPAPAPPPKTEAAPVDSRRPIPKGYRLFTVQTAANDIQAGGLQCGDRVDVLITAALEGGPTAQVARVLIQSQEIWNVGTAGSPLKGARRSTAPAIRVDLLVTSADALLLAAAAESGALRLVARNPQDRKEVDTDAAVFSSVTGAEKLTRGNQALTAAIPSGMRAMTIQISDTDGILSRLMPGDRVDVLVTCPFSKFSSSGDTNPGAQGRVTEYRMATRFLLQDVAILAIAPTLEAGMTLARESRRVTLLVAPGEAEKLTVVRDATQKSVIRLLARNGTDPSRTNSDGQALADLLTRQHRYHQVDIFRGTNASKREFYTGY